MHLRPDHHPSPGESRPAADPAPPVAILPRIACVRRSAATQAMPRATSSPARATAGNGSGGNPRVQAWAAAFHELVGQLAKALPPPPAARSWRRVPFPLAGRLPPSGGNGR